jgi:Bacterial RNA polymerase, alpha chain C terminal domain
MPTRSPGDVSAGTISDLGLPGRAVAALARAGIHSTGELAALTRRELTAIPGLGPGTITAIRRVVPEPPAGTGRAGTPPAGREHRAARDPAEEQSPPIPSLASLRDPRRRTAVDLLVPPPPPPPPPPPHAAPDPPAEAGPAPEGPRPAEYADLLRLGVRVARALAGIPGRLLLWSVREPVGCLRRLAHRPGAGGEPGPGRG